MSQVVVLKLPKGATAPAGFTFVKSLRAGDIYHKNIIVPTKSDIDDLADMFNRNISIAVIEPNQEEDFINQLEMMSLKGGSKKKRRTRRKSRRH